jgi:hypothetical protein
VSADKSDPPDTTVADEPARSLLDKVRRFVQQDLTDEERALFAALIGPGVARAHLDADEVVGFDSATWLPDALPQHLSDEIRTRDLRIEGL